MCVKTYMYVIILLYSLVQATSCFFSDTFKIWEYPPIFLYVHWYGGNTIIILLMYMHMYNNVWHCVLCMCVYVWICIGLFSVSFCDAIVKSSYFVCAVHIHVPVAEASGDYDEHEWLQVTGRLLHKTSYCMQTFIPTSYSVWRLMWFLISGLEEEQG